MGGVRRGSNLAEALPGPVQTNNRAELLVSAWRCSKLLVLRQCLQAIIRAIETCPFPDLPLEIRTDSSYSIKCAFLSNPP